MRQRDKSSGSYNNLLSAVFMLLLAIVLIFIVSSGGIGNSIINLGGNSIFQEQNACNIDTDAQRKIAEVDFLQKWTSENGHRFYVDIESVPNDSKIEIQKNGEVQRVTSKSKNITYRPTPGDKFVVSQLTKDYDELQLSSAEIDDY